METCGLLLSIVLCFSPSFFLLGAACIGYLKQEQQEIFTREEVGRILHREVSHVSRVDKMAYDIQSRQALALIDEFKQKISELKAKMAENDKKMAECGYIFTSTESENSPASTV